MDSLVKLLVDFTVPCIQAIVACHLEIFFGDVLDEHLNKINRRKGFPDKRIVFMFVVMKGNRIPIVRINSGKGDYRTAQVTADRFDNRIRVAEAWFCVNIKAVFVLEVYLRFCVKEGPMRFSSLFNRTVWKDLRR